MTMRDRSPRGREKLAGAMPAVPALRVYVIEDDARYRESLELLFSHSPGFSLAGSYGAAEEALETIGADATNTGAMVVAMDLDLPGVNGIEATRRLKRARPEALVVVLTVFDEPARILEAICAGADGYLLKRTPPHELLEQLRAVAEGGAPLTASVARTVLGLLRPAVEGGAAHPAPQLTDRERDVLAGLVRGLAYKQVAESLGISLDTVRTHIRGIYRKLQVHSVAEAVGRAIRERLT
jgi:DNA-binding NarL/FixJ family response regulator